LILKLRLPAPSEFEYFCLLILVKYGYASR
jgi:hypothetical protein